MYSHSRITKSLSQQETLTWDQQKALESTLRPFGFTVEQMIHWRGMYYQPHTDALTYLCRKGASSHEAIQIVSGLDIPQAKGIAAGLTREEVIDFNGDQIKSLAALKGLGLTVDHLRSWVVGENEQFWGSHYEALKFLMIEKKMAPDLAIAEIGALTPDEAYAIVKGLTRTQVIGLNENQHKALIKLQSYGLTADHLRNWQSPNKAYLRGENGFNLEHREALERLIEKCRLNPELAIEEINELKASQARGIAHGLKRSEVIGLEEGQIKTLIELLKKGITTLTAEHLREWQGDYFSSSHTAAVVQLVAKRGFLGSDAVKEVNGLDEFEARMIAVKSLTRDEVFGFNGWQVDLLQSLKNKGLKPCHLRSWEPSQEEDNFLGGLTNAITYLLEKGMAPEKAIEEINGLTDDQARRIPRGESREEILRGMQFSM